MSNVQQEMSNVQVAARAITLLGLGEILAAGYLDIGHFLLDIGHPSLLLPPAHYRADDREQHERVRAVYQINPFPDSATGEEPREG